MLIDIYKKNKAFIIPYVGLLLIMLPVLLFVSKRDIHLFINSYHSRFFDFLFRYLTQLGSGVFAVIVSLAFLFFSFRKTFQVTASTTLAGILVQLLKRLFFYNAVRPLTYFKGIAELHLIKGVEMYHAHSFPSGHSATIFALCFTIVLFTRNDLLKTGLFILAVSVAFSRVYLSQHFLLDVYVGSIIGIICVPYLKIVFDRLRAGLVDKSLVEIIRSSGKKKK
jgi:membrane-associated phospholipid phosphatase